MMIQAVLGNPNHPEYGVATIPFPIPRDQYAHCMELLEALEIGDAVNADCKVEKIDSFYTVLKRAEMLTVNVEELNYLAKRLESFDTGEAAQFQAMAHKLELFELKDLINLTFCCQQATVITDFSDLAAIGRDHYMNLHGGSASVDELNALDDKGTARQLIESGSGTVTPYGVVYDNGMKLEQVYDGRFFPCYYYKPNVITVAVTSKAEPEDTEHITWLFLPMVQEEIDRALLRGGITDPADVRLRLEDSQLPNEADILLDMECETLSDLNELAAATDGLSKADMEKLGAVVMLAKPKSAAQIKNLAENSGEAADEISSLIDSVTSLIEETVNQSGRSTEQINESAAAVFAAAEQFNNIYESIEQTNRIVQGMIEKVHEVNDVASNMAAITEEQSASAEEIEATAVSIQELADIVSENSADVQKDSKEMESTAETLKKHISRFTI